MTVSTCDRLYDCIRHHSREYSWECTRTRTRVKCTRTRTHVLVKMYSAPGLLDTKSITYSQLNTWADCGPKESRQTKYSFFGDFYIFYFAG